MENEWIKEESTASEVVNHTGSSISNTIDAVRIWAKLKHRKARYQAIDRVLIESAKPTELQDWSAVVADIQNLQF